MKECFELIASQDKWVQYVALCIEEFYTQSGDDGLALIIQALCSHVPKEVRQMSPLSLKFAEAVAMESCLRPNEFPAHLVISFDEESFQISVEI